VDEKYIMIRGYIEIPSDMTHQEFLNEFYKLIKSKGWHFGGITKELFEKENVHN
jgi:hypothetical protein